VFQFGLGYEQGKTEILKGIYVEDHRKVCGNFVPLRAWVLCASFQVI